MAPCKAAVTHHQRGWAAQKLLLVFPEEILKEVKVLIAQLGTGGRRVLDGSNLVLKSEEFLIIDYILPER